MVGWCKKEMKATIVGSPEFATPLVVASRSDLGRWSAGLGKERRRGGEGFLQQSKDQARTFAEGG